MERGLRRDGVALGDFAAKLASVLGNGAERLLVVERRLLLRPASAGLVSGGDVVVSRALVIAGLVPVVSEGRSYLARLGNSFLEKHGDCFVPLAATRSRQRRVRHLADQLMLEGELGVRGAEA